MNPFNSPKTIFVIFSFCVLSCYCDDTTGKTIINKPEIITERKFTKKHKIEQIKWGKESNILGVLFKQSNVIHIFNLEKKKWNSFKAAKEKNRGKILYFTFIYNNNDRYLAVLFSSPKKQTIINTIMIRDPGWTTSLILWNMKKTSEVVRVKIDAGDYNTIYHINDRVNLEDLPKKKSHLYKLISTDQKISIMLTAGGVYFSRDLKYYVKANYKKKQLSGGSFGKDIKWEKPFDVYNLNYPIYISEATRKIVCVIDRKDNKLLQFLNLNDGKIMSSINLPKKNKLIGYELLSDHKFVLYYSDRIYLIDINKPKLNLLVNCKDYSYSQIYISEDENEIILYNSENNKLTIIKESLGEKKKREH